jgi:hypothetical protein
MGARSPSSSPIAHQNISRGVPSINVHNTSAPDNSQNPSLPRQETHLSRSHSISTSGDSGIGSTGSSGKQNCNNDNCPHGSASVSDCGCLPEQNSSLNTVDPRVLSLDYIQPPSTALGNLPQQALRVRRAFIENGEELLGYTSPTDRRLAEAALDRMRSAMEELIQVALTARLDAGYPKDDTIMEY